MFKDWELHLYHKFDGNSSALSNPSRRGLQLKVCPAWLVCKMILLKLNLQNTGIAIYFSTKEHGSEEPVLDYEGFSKCWLQSKYFK